MPICLSIVGYIIIYSTSLKLLGNFQPLLVFILRLSQNFFRRNVISQLGNYNYKHNNLTRFTMLFKLLTKIHYRKQGVYKDQLWKFIRQNFFFKNSKSTMSHFVILYHASIFLMNIYSKASLRRLLLFSLELYTRTFRKGYKISLEIFNISELCS